MKNAGFDQQLKVFEKLGFKLNPGVTKDDIANKWGIDAYKKQSFSLLYSDLGATLEKEPWTPVTDQAYWFDTEAIEDSGDYVRILNNLQRISKGELVFTSLADIVDFENEKASVSFKLNGDAYRYDLEFKDDWVDPKLFTHVVELTKKYNTKGRFTYFSQGGQDLVIGYATPSELAKLRKETGLKISWLS